MANHVMTIDRQAFSRTALGAASWLALLGLTVTACKDGEKTGEAKSKAEEVAEAKNPTVKGVCEERKTAWTKASYRKCTTCQAEATTPKCGDCNKAPHAAQCARVNGALIGNTACDEARICKLKCKRGDCDCEAECFDGKPECEKLAAVVDACVLEQCAPICK